MLRILFLTEYLTGGGAEKVLCDLVRQMNPDIFDITVQSIWQSDPDGLLPSNVRYRYCHPNTKAARLRFRAEAELGLTYPLHVRDRYDIEVAFHEFAPTKILAASFNQSAKKIAWVHCDLKRATKKPSDFPKIMGWYRKYDRIVCVSRSVQKVFDSVFNGQLESTVLHNALDGDAVLQKAHTAIELPSCQRPVVCTVGRLDVPKNQLRLLRAHKQLLDEGLCHSLWIVGDGPDRSELESFVQENHLQDSVTLFGYQENPYVYMLHADLLACSSDSEGLSTFVSEGLVLGKAILTTDCGGMQELLGDSEFGLIVENSDRAFTDGLRYMLQNNNVREVYADKANQKMNVEPEGSAKQIEDFFLRITEE